MSDAPASPAPDEPDASDPAAPEGLSTAIRVAAALVGLEVLALVGLAIGEIVSVDSDRPSVGITTAIFFLLYAAGLAFCIRGLLRLNSWARGPIVLAQLIELGVAWSFRGGDTTWVAILLGLPSVVVLVVMFAPPTTEALYGHRLLDSDETR